MFYNFYAPDNRFIAQVEADSPCEAGREFADSPQCFGYASALAGRPEFLVFTECSDGDDLDFNPHAISHTAGLEPLEDDDGYRLHAGGEDNEVCIAPPAPASDPDLAVLDKFRLAVAAELGQPVDRPALLAVLAKFVATLAAAPDSRPTPD